MANNTALRAGKDTTRTITFKNKEHEKFYYTYLPKCRYQDVYHKALVYCTKEHGRFENVWGGTGQHFREDSKTALPEK